MSNPAKPLTTEELAALEDLPQYYKDAIEHAIDEFCLDEADEDWPNYFRGEVVAMERECQIEEQLDVTEYETQCVWFVTGWKAALEAKNK